MRSQAIANPKKESVERLCEKALKASEVPLSKQIIFVIFSFI